MTRAFRLRNASGDMIDLLADLDIFGVSPEGLGVSFEHTSHLSNSNYLLEKSTLHQNEFKLSVVFGYVSHDPYNAYYKLVKFLDKAPYKLEYETPAGTWQREVRLKELTKTEIVSGDVMMENFTLSCFTPWYRNVESKYDPATDIQGDGKIYKWFDSRIRRKMLYAFAYSADGTEGFATNYPQDNMLSSIYPFDTKKRFSFKTNDSTNSKYTIGSDKLSLTAVASDKWAQLSLSSIVDGAAAATPELATIAAGEVYTMSGKFTPTSDINSNMVINIVMYYINQARTRVNLSGKNVRAPELQKGVPYYYYDTTNVIPSDIATARSVFMSITFQGTGTIEIESVKLEPGDKATGNKGNPTYIGERVVQADYKENINLVTRSNIFPIENASGTIDFKSWYGEGLFTFNKTGGVNSGIYLMSKKVLQRNVEYNLHIELRDSINGLRNFFIYNPFQGDYTSSIIVDGEPSNKGFGKRASDVYWLGDPDRPEYVDKQWHTIDITFNLSDTATIEWYEGIISQPDKGLDRKINVEHKHVMLTEGPYPGYYTQEEIPEYYTWSSLEGKWTPPTPDGKQHDLTYDNKIYDYVYSTPRMDDIINGYAGYDYDYIYEGYANGSNGVFNINNEAIYMGNQKGSPVEIFIDGPSKNPYWQVIKDGEIIMQDGFNIEIGDGSRLVVSSVPGEQRAELVSADGVVSNVYQQQRLDLDNFITIPPGYSTIAFFNAKKVSFNLREERVVV